jgi:hypothetical protein
MPSSINLVHSAVTAMKPLRQFQEELYCKSQKKQFSDAVDYLVPTHCKWLFWKLFTVHHFHPKVQLTFSPCSMQESKGFLHNNCYLTVHHVLWSSTELLIAFDHLVHYLQEVTLSDSFLMGSNCIHASLHAYTANISTCAFNIHFLREVEVTNLLLVCVYCLYTRI